MYPSLIIVSPTAAAQCVIWRGSSDSCAKEAFGGNGMVMYSHYGTLLIQSIVLCLTECVSRVLLIVFDCN